jgi:hypothetical protein
MVRTGRAVEERLSRGSSVQPIDGHPKGKPMEGLVRTNGPTHHHRCTTHSIDNTRRHIANETVELLCWVFSFQYEISEQTHEGVTL